MPAALIEIKYAHVHDCQADREGRPCLFNWGQHSTIAAEKFAAICACGPRVDDTNLLLDGQVFVVHVGVC